MGVVPAMTIRTCAFGALVAASVVLGVTGQAQTPAAGPFTADQAATGRAAFDTTCLSCHGSGQAPPLQGAEFTAGWGSRSTRDLLSAIQAMPPDAPGGLPAATYLAREGERVHPITARLANESRHFEHVAGEHDLNAFFALRTMDEVMVNNFMTFADLMREEHYDLVIGDESWDVDYYYHENPELKRQPFVFLTDFVGCLPMGGDAANDEREAHLCADRNADDIEHVARFPYVRDAAIFVGNPEDVTEDPFGPGLPSIREWTDRNFSYSGYALPFDPKAFSDAEKTRRKLGYKPEEKIAIAAVGGTGVGRHLLERIAQAFPRMKREVPELRLVLVAGPRLSPDTFPRMDGLEVKPYVHNLFEHLACCDLALVQGGLSTCMELVALRRPFLSFPLRRHFEQCVHVRRRLGNYGADFSMPYREITTQSLAERALAAMHRPVRYKAVETDGAARAARRIAQVLENRWWVQR
jgi:cytochrome c5